MPPVPDVVTFAQLFVEMADLQDDKKDNKGKDDIVITNTACKP